MTETETFCGLSHNKIHRMIAWFEEHDINPQSDSFEQQVKHFMPDYIDKQKVRNAICNCCLHPDSAADLRKELEL